MRVFPLIAGAALSLAGSLALAADPDQAIRQTLNALQPDLPIERSPKARCRACTRYSCRAAGSSMPAPTASSSCRATCFRCATARRST